MPWFYFHLRTPTAIEHDEIGLELSGPDAAYLEACHTIPALCADLMHERASMSRCAFEITDAAGRLLMAVPFSEVLDKGGRPARPHSALRRKAAAEVDRTARLIEDIRQAHTTLQATFDETKHLLACARRIGAPAFGNALANQAARLFDGDDAGASS